MASEVASVAGRFLLRAGVNLNQLYIKRYVL